MDCLAHSDDAPDGDLGRAAGAVEVDLRRARLAAGEALAQVPGDEEIAFVLAGAAGEAGPGHAALLGGEPLLAGPDGADVLVFASAGNPRRDPPPARVVSLDGAEAEREDHGPHRFVNRDLGWRLGSRRAGLQQQTLDPGAEGFPPHCHSAEEELFYVLDGAGTVRIGEEEAPVRAGTVVSRPAGTAVSHSFVAAPDQALVTLAYGTRRPADVVLYARTGMVSIRGVRRLVRSEPRGEYWGFATS